MRCVRLRSGRATSGSAHSRAGAGVRVLQPAHLRRRPVALVVLGGDAEDDRRLRARVDQRLREVRVGNDALRLRAAVHAHERQLLPARAAGRLPAHRQVHRVLDDLRRRAARRRLPTERRAEISLRKHRSIHN